MRVDAYVRLADISLRRDLEDYLRRLAQAINDVEVRTGTTANRPAGDDLRAGRQYFDTTIGKPVWYDGAAWKDSAGVAA